MKIVITGASSGIGLALAEHYDKENEVLRISRHHGFDITKDAEKIRLYIGHRPVDVLINCAGIASMNHSFFTTSDRVKTILDTNVSGTFSMTQIAVSSMRKGYGRIINFGSIASRLALEGEAIYAASKSAVEMLTKVMAKEFGSYGITVNCICPNPIETNMIKNVPKHKIEAIIERQAIKRHGTMQDITNLVDFLIKPESSFITGQIINLGGL